MKIILSHLSYILWLFHYYKIVVYVLDSFLFKIKVNVILVIIYYTIFESAENDYVS